MHISWNLIKKEGNISLLPGLELKGESAKLQEKFEQGIVKRWYTVPGRGIFFFISGSTWRN